MTAVLFKAAGISVASAALYLLLKKDNPSFAFLLTVAATGAVLISAGQLLAAVLTDAQTLAESAGLGSAELSAVLKALGIAWVTKFAAQISSDAGQGALAAVINQCGAAGILCCAMPLLMSVLDTIRGLL